MRRVRKYIFVEKYTESPVADSDTISYFISFYRLECGGDTPFQRVFYLFGHNNNIIYFIYTRAADAPHNNNNNIIL